MRIFWLMKMSYTLKKINTGICDDYLSKKNYSIKQEDKTRKVFKFFKNSCIEEYQF